ncbi:hypothetical protein [Pseudomonas arsenicoxydans]|uniref:Uncharacterized protein n=1 Tax=Pseudomonas arsenicoxydans TaxID=702115 RepID=A0A502HUF9_9PSED|nr:hypothetical protein [Pseudomonas arsenicoxydans]TPG77354.1 hypothetical protein EAH78_14245 [Pseudomonas arsenicoxydans]
MIGEGIHEDALTHLVQQRAVRECLVARIDGGPTWGLSIRLGGSGARWVPVRSRREKVRTWASLTAVGRFADGIGLRGFSVEL